MAYSVRSSALRSLSSAMTAPTNPSVSSSVIQSSSKSFNLKSQFSTQTGASQKLAPLKQDLVWARYKKKNEQQARERAAMRSTQQIDATPDLDRRSVHSIARSSNREQRANSMALIPNTVNIALNPTAPEGPLRTPEQSNSSRRSHRSVLSADQPLNYPFLPGNMDTKKDERFAKRVIFDHSDYDDLLGKIIDQIHEKKDRELLDKIKDREDEQGLLEY